MTNSIADKVDEEKGQKPFPHIVLYLEIELAVEKETEYHSYLVADGVGNQFVYVVMADQGKDADVNSGCKQTDDAVKDKVTVLFVEVFAVLFELTHSLILLIVCKDTKLLLFGEILIQNHSAKLKNRGKII